MKLSDIRISNIKELQAFLTSKGIEFESNLNKAGLQDLVRQVIEAQAAASDEDSIVEHGSDVPPPPKADLEQEAIAAQEKAEAEAQKVRDSVQSAKEEADRARVQEEKAEADRAKKEEAKRLKAKKDAEDAKIKTVDPNEVGTPGDRRDVPLATLLVELSTKGFKNKQELADLLEAEVRERKSLETAKKEQSDHEAAIFQKEMKLDQRIRDNEEEFKRVLVHRKQCEEMLAKAVALNERNRR